MAKKNYDVGDPGTWNEAQMNKYIIDTVKEIGLNLPWETIILSSVFTYGHWKAYGAGTLPTIGDVMLGIVYAMTIPPALKGGLVANSYAVGALGVLGVGLLVPADAKKDDEWYTKLEGYLEDLGQGIIEAPGNLVNSVGNFWKGVLNID